MKDLASGIVQGIRGERGMALFSALIILAAVSLVAVGLSSDTSSEMKIAGNRRVHQQAFQLADGGADLAIQVLLDHLYPDIADPENDYPPYDTSVSLLDGELTMNHFQRDVNLMKDIQGYDGNDNDLDPGNGSPDISFDLHPYPESGLPFADTHVVVDIDRLRVGYVHGSSIEYAAGYEGVGKGAAAGSVIVVFGVTSTATPSNSPSVSPEVVVVYRKVSQIIGGSKE